MLSFLKKRVTSQELGVALHVYVAGSRSEESERAALRELQPGSKVDQNNLSFEMIYLRIFAIDFAVSITLEARTKGAVLDVFYARLREKAGELGAKFFTELKDRLLVYTSAVKDYTHELGPPYAIGKAFAEVCGHPMAATIILIGSKTFVDTYKAVSALVKQLRVV